MLYQGRPDLVLGIEGELFNSPCLLLQQGNALTLAIARHADVLVV